MSVFTRVDSADLAVFLERYALGSARGLQPIEAGVTNSNYFLETDAGSYVLTLYEIHSPADLDYILGLQQHLARRGVRCATPIEDNTGGLYSELNQRPAAIIQRLPGTVPSSPGEDQCRAVAAELARFHLAGSEFGLSRPNPRGIDWIIATRHKLGGVLDAADMKLIDSTLRAYRVLPLGALPAGSVHADLFHDNVLFTGAELGGICDFDYACVDSYCLDIAVLLNDWCRGDAASLDRHRVGLTLDAYCSIRELVQAEIESLPAMLAFTALRFWLSRLHDKTFPLPGELILVKPPGEFRAILEDRLANSTRLLADTEAGKNSAE